MKGSVSAQLYTIFKVKGSTVVKWTTATTVSVFSQASGFLKMSRQRPAAAEAKAR